MDSAADFARLQNAEPTEMTRLLSMDSDDIRPLWQAEKDIIERAIELCHGNVMAAASRLGISDSTIYRKRRKWLV